MTKKISKNYLQWKINNIHCKNSETILTFITYAHMNVNLYNKLCHFLIVKCLLVTPPISTHWLELIYFRKKTATLITIYYENIWNWWLYNCNNVCHLETAPQLFFNRDFKIPGTDKSPLGQKATGHYPTGQKPTALFGRVDKSPLF